MPCGVVKALKSWGPWLACSSFFSKRKRSQPNPLDRQMDGMSASESYALKEKAITYDEDNNLDFVDDQASTLPVSVLQLSVRKQDSFFDCQIKLPRRPLSSDEPLHTEDEFMNAISEAQKYKDACAAAEEAAEEEARRRFKHYQDMYYLEKEIQDKVVDAHRKLQRVRRSALEAGFSHLVPKSPSPSGIEEGSRNASQDTINRLIARLDEKELDLLFAARMEKNENMQRGGSPLKEEICS